MGVSFHFFGEDVAGIAFTINMKDPERDIMKPFLDIIASEVYVTDVLHGDIVGPVPTSFIIIVNGGRR